MRRFHRVSESLLSENKSAALNAMSGTEDSHRKAECPIGDESVLSGPTS